MQIIKAIAEDWFLREPAFYSLFCLQQLHENVRMGCPVRCGEGLIEYNPLLLAHHNYKETERLLRIEMIRLFLKHPYQRRPDGCSGEVIARGSDCTIADGYCLLREAELLNGPAFYHLPMGQCYEWYCKALQQKDDDDNKDENENENKDENENGKRKADSDRSELWHDDSLRQAQINDIIERTSDWGTLPADIVQQIKASTRARLNSQLVMQGFRSSLLSARRILTRMRPNRRTGFLQMGSRRSIGARLLVAIDVSGSIDDETLSRFYSTVNRLFRDTNVQIDALQFDSAISSVIPFDHIMHEVTVTGRGGTSFQPVIDFFSPSVYDGLMIFTDGQAPAPVIPSHKSFPILWICNTEDNYRSSHRWMERSGRCCWM